MEADWRIGLTVKTKIRSHDLFYERGNVMDVLPSGTGGFLDKNGVLKIELDSGRVILDRSENWMTA